MKFTKLLSESEVIEKINFNVYMRPQDSRLCEDVFQVLLSKAKLDIADLNLRAPHYLRYTLQIHADEA